MTQSLRVAVVCRMGVIRSVTMVNLLKDRGHKAVAMGMDHHKGLQAAVVLADVILLVPLIRELKPGKVRQLERAHPDVREISTIPGRDTWGRVGHPDLVDKLTQWLDTQPDLGATS